MREKRKKGKEEGERLSEKERETSNRRGNQVVFGVGQRRRQRGKDWQKYPLLFI